MFDLVRPLRVAGAIDIIDNAFGNCDEVLELLTRQKNWMRSTVDGSEVTEDRTSDVLFVDFYRLDNHVMLFEFAKKLYQYLDDYGKRYNVGFAGLEPGSLNRYSPGQMYRIHSDDGPLNPRTISALVYMNDVKGGGQTRFPLFGETVEPKKGRLVIFPSNYAYQHEALPPTKGIKYSLAVWARRLTQ